MTQVVEKTNSEIYMSSKASEFCLPDQDNSNICLKDFQGKWVVLYFYPKDNTSGCTLEAIDFTSKVDEFEEEIDEDHLRAKISFIHNSEEVNAPTFLILKDLADSLEHAADMCADTSDFIMVLAASEE